MPKLPWTTTESGRCYAACIGFHSLLVGQHPKHGEKAKDAKWGVKINGVVQHPKYASAQEAQNGAERMILAGAQATIASLSDDTTVHFIFDQILKKMS